MDGIEDGWAIPLLIAGFVTIWMLFLAIAYVGGNLHQDVLETWTLGRSLDWGSSKHPPLMAWAARAWTSIFPLTDWSFQFLALTNSAIGLWFVDRIARQFVRGDKRLIVLLLLMLMPIYQLHAQRFNANAVLLSTWPLATFCFLRSFETRAASWAIATGATAALAMLGKYYSIFLIGSFALAAICHPERRAYLISPAPWIAMATGLLALLPHIHWLATTGAQPFAYAMEHHSGKAPGPALAEAIGFILAIGALAAIPALIWLAVARPQLRRIRNDVGNLNAGPLLIAIIGIGTVALPSLTATIIGTDMPPLWGLQGLFLFVILIVCGASYSVPRQQTVNLAATAVGVALFAALVVAPLHAFYRNYQPLHEGRNFYRGAVAELTRQWHVQSEMPLPVVGGDEGLAFAAAFYSDDHPRYETRLVNPHIRQLTDISSFENGWAALCYDTDDVCVSGLQQVAALTSRAIRSEFALQSTLFGQPGASQGFIALIVPPAVEIPKPPADHDIAEEFSAKRRAPQVVN